MSRQIKDLRMNKNFIIEAVLKESKDVIDEDVVTRAILQKYPRMQKGVSSKGDMEWNMSSEEYQLYINVKRKTLTVFDYDGYKIVTEKKWNTISDLMTKIKKYAEKSRELASGEW